MAKKFIKAADVRKGDSIKVRFTVEDTTITREGIVDDIQEVLSVGYQFRTARGYSLGPTSEKACTIQLLSRPKTAIVLPTGEHAVISYEKANGEKWFSVLRDGHWHFTAASELGKIAPYTFTKNPVVVPEFLTENGRKNYTVLFAGVTK